MSKKSPASLSGHKKRPTPSCNAQTPTAAELRTAIEVLNQLGERMSLETTHSILLLPQTQLGARYAESIEQRAMEHACRIKGVSHQLEIWCADLGGQPETKTASGRNEATGFASKMKSFWMRLKHGVAAKISPPKMVPKAQS